MTKFPHLRAALYNMPWAIMFHRLEAIAEVFERRAEGILLSEEEIKGIKGERKHNAILSLCEVDAEGQIGPISAQGQGGANGGVIAVINMMGIIAQHASQVDNISGPGGTSVERLTNNFRAALDNPSVSAIIFNIDSPGGNVNGVQALAEEIYRARGKKPIIAQCNSLMASAAYWIGAAADEIVMTPGAQAGSIGVYAMHVDKSASNEQKGERFTYISAGKYKVEGNPHSPLDEEAAAAMQATVDAYYQDFTSAVAKFRGTSTKAVQDGYGQGRVEKDKAAVRAGLADSIGTLDETIRKVAAGKMGRKGRMKAQLEGLPTIDATRFDYGALTVHSDRTSPDNEILRLVGVFPENLRLAADLLDDERYVSMCEAPDGPHLLFRFANASALYKIDGVCSHDTFACTLVSGMVTEPFDPDEPATEPAAAETQESEPQMSAEDRAAYRRRRHALRMRKYAKA